MRNAFVRRHGRELRRRPGRGRAATITSRSSRLIQVAPLLAEQVQNRRHMRPMNRGSVSHWPRSIQQAVSRLTHSTVIRPLPKNRDIAELAADARPRGQSRVGGAG